MTEEELQAQRIAAIALKQGLSVVEAAHALGWAAPHQRVLEVAEEVLDVHRRPYQVVLALSLEIGDVDTSAGEVVVRFGDDRLTVTEMGEVLGRVRECAMDALRRAGAV